MDAGEKIEQKIDIKITEKLMNKMEAKLRIFHKKWTGLTQKSIKTCLRGNEKATP